MNIEIQLLRQGNISSPEWTASKWPGDGLSEILVTDIYVFICIVSIYKTLCLEKFILAWRQRDIKLVYNNLQRISISWTVKQYIF